MSRFRYARDPLCVLACAGYATNRWLLPLSLKGFFLRNYFDDTLLIPAALPLLLWVHYRFGWRPGAAKPAWSEILLHFAVWSVAAEVVAPHLFAHATGDPWDVVAYAGGAVVSGVLWQWG
jgi:membrane-associated PAP2 superfamily phosphatase